MIVNTVKWPWPACAVVMRRMFNVCVVGSGVAGLSTAGKLIKQNPNVKVDVLDKLPVPFGLIRYGVAPDHKGVKNSTRFLSSIAELENCRFVGNVTMGKDVTLSQLQQLYHAVVLAVGVQESCRMGIPGEDLPGVHSARDFYSWYNGLPSHREFKPDLSGEEVAVIGHGNVALDIARVLLVPIEVLEKTDICDHALKELHESQVKRVHLIGRHTPLQVTFSTKEVRNMSSTHGCCFTTDLYHFEGIQHDISALPRPRQRLLKLLTQVVHEQNATTVSCGKEWNLHFLRTPKKIFADKNSHRVAGIQLGVNTLDVENHNKIIESNKEEMLYCSMVLTSIGFHLPLLDGIPESGSTQQTAIPNKGGRVIDSTGSAIPGLYCSGWAKTGPNGGLQNTMNSSYETAHHILEDYTQGKLILSDGQSNSGVLERLHSLQATSFSDWKLIDKVEKLKAQSRGLGKPKEKITSFEDMLRILELYKTTR